MPYLYPQADRLQLRPHLIELLDIPPRAHQIFRLHLHGTHLTALGILLDLRDELLLLVLELRSFAVELTLGLFKSALVFAEALGGGHALAEGPFYDLAQTVSMRESYAVAWPGSVHSSLLVRLRSGNGLVVGM